MQSNEFNSKLRMSSWRGHVESCEAIGVQPIDWHSFKTIWTICRGEEVPALLMATKFANKKSNQGVPK